MKLLQPIYVKDLKQLSPEWFKFRELGLGSSDAGIVSGLLPEMWDGYYSLKLQRIKGVKKTFSPEKEEVIVRGQELEPEARAAYEKLTGNKVEPACFIHPRRSWQRASLDGITEDWSTILEIKCSKERVYNKVAEEETAPKYYFAQVQHQLATIPTARRAHFWMYDPTEGGILIEITPDPQFIKELIRRENWYWNALQEERRIYSGMLGKAMKVNEEFTRVLYNAPKLKKEKQGQENEQTPNTGQIELLPTSL